MPEPIENGAVMDEIDDAECVDQDGEVYPEHDESRGAYECRRCGAELEVRP